jgi:hypothetical protein
MRFVVKLISTGDGLPSFLRASCSGSVSSTLVVSVSMSVVLRGAQKFRVDTALEAP